MREGEGRGEVGWGGMGGLIMTRRISHDVGTVPWTLHVGLKLT